jgi:hypothetical protein
MAKIDGEIVIGRPVDVVFDYVADQSNEPQYNRQMVRADKITTGPVGRGTRCRSVVASRERTAESSVLTHENERRWRIFHQRVEQINRPPSNSDAGAELPLG